MKLSNIKEILPALDNVEFQLENILDKIAGRA
jgi:hypothetical protein